MNLHEVNIEIRWEGKVNCSHSYAAPTNVNAAPSIG